MQTGRKKVNLSKTITLKLSIILGLFLAIINPMTTAAQARSTTDWIKKSSSVINGDYSVTHYMTTYYMESNTAESWKVETLHQGDYTYTSHGYSVMEYVSGGKVVKTSGRIKAVLGNMIYKSTAIIWDDGIVYHHQAHCGIDMNN